ncbi:MAG: hypothetical protein JNJ71_04970 [Rubrivivax sp.]|nr:hypothetical protein [Rubrivivax sp.]
MYQGLPASAAATDAANTDAAKDDTMTAPPFVPQMRRHQNWLARERGLHFGSYDALWR